jgi:hypothetical protein
MLTDADCDDPEDQHDVVDGPICTVTETKLFSTSHEHDGAANHDTEAASAYALGPTHCSDAGNDVGVVMTRDRRRRRQRRRVAFRTTLRMEACVH